MLDELAWIGQSVARCVLRASHGECGAQAGEHRHVAESVAGAEYVDGAATVHHIDAAGANDVDALQSRSIGAHDLRACGVELHLDVRCQALQVVGSRKL
jgi:alkylated DNA repair dioxygenase AlkB